MLRVFLSLKNYDDVLPLLEGHQVDLQNGSGPLQQKVASGNYNLVLSDGDASVVPSIKLAPMPVVQQPSAAPKPEEPAPQKPDIKLPLDAIRASKAGAKPLQEHLRKQEQKRQDR